MGSTLERVSFSPNIKERRDYSCAVFDTQGQLIAQAAHIPVHLGAMEFLLRKWLQEGPPMVEGKAYITNDPYFAGTHLPDVSLIYPVGEIGYVAARAHHSDIGGATPGSFSPVDDVRKEGMIIAPQELTTGLIDEICLQCRGSEERRSDLAAQLAAVRIGARRLLKLSERFGNEFEGIADQCLAYSETLTRAALSKVPNGVFRAEDTLEDIADGRIVVSLTIADCAIEFDFEGTAPQASIGVNATEAVTKSACYYAVRCLAPDTPTNAGCWKPVSVKTPEASLVNAQFPAPVVAGNTETSQRIVDVILQSLPVDAPACSQGTMNNIAFGTDEWAYYETIGGGAGAGPSGPGASGIHTHMTNTRNTPIEAIEIDAPLRVVQYEMRLGSGGNGLHRGGDGIIRAYEALTGDITCSLMTERRRLGPPGRNGGQNGTQGRNVLVRSDEEILLPAKGVVTLLKGDVVRVETPGGGGWGA
ncbi:MAG: hydantoinase B/oxoprolinase family protein [Armatimonadota bacterium]|nr:hydantoinase B/oxoprolinase family protein [Armatimonadota bacterium]